MLILYTIQITIQFSNIFFSKKIVYFVFDGQKMLVLFAVYLSAFVDFELDFWLLYCFVVIEN